MGNISSGADGIVQRLASRFVPTTARAVHSDVRSLSGARARPFGMTLKLELLR